MAKYGDTRSQASEAFILIVLTLLAVCVGLGVLAGHLADKDELYQRMKDTPAYQQEISDNNAN